MKNKNKVKADHPKTAKPVEAQATTLNQTAPESQSPTTAPVLSPVVVPPAFKDHDKSLSDVGLAYAIELGKKHPEIVNAVVEMKDALGKAGEKFFSVASALRSAKLVGKEASMLLYGLGFSKQRVSDMKALSSVSDEVWTKYSASQIGFRAALALEAGPTGGTEGESEGGVEGDGDEQKPKKAKHKVHAMPKDAAQYLNGLATLKLSMKGGQRTEYGHTVELPDGKFYYVSIFADSDAKK